VKVVEIGFEHLECRFERILWPSDIGAPTHRQVPVGMPKLRREMADSVFYLYRRNPKTGEIEGPCGTGSLVAKRSPVPLNIDLYGVSNYHVTNDLGASIIRLNTKDGKSRLLEYDPSEWHFLTGGDDLSMVDLTDDVHPETDQIASHDEGTFITPRYRHAIRNWTWRRCLHDRHVCGSSWGRPQQASSSFRELVACCR
jgi:hypothetical protein